MNETTKLALKEVETALQTSEAALAKEAPDQLARIKSIVQEVRQGKIGSEKIRGQVVELMKWQFDLQRKTLKTTLDQLTPLAAGNPAAKKSEVAIKKVLEMLDKAETAMGSPTAAAQKVLAQAGDQAREAIEAAQEAIKHSTLGIPMKPVNGPIVSSSGVALKPVIPGKAAKAAPAGATVTKSKNGLDAFKVRPGVGPSAPASGKGNGPKRRS